ncbi:MAG: M48 family metallopeptidase [Halieaceae bacterium]
MIKTSCFIVCLLMAPLLHADVAVAEFDPVAATNAQLAVVSPEASANTDGYVNAGYQTMLLEPLLTVIVAFLLLQLGWSRRWRELAERAVKWRFLQAFIYVPIYLLVTTALLFPFSWYRDFHIEHKYGLATQDFGAWFVEFLQSTGVALVGMSLFVGVLYLILRWSPQRWWMWGAGLVVGFIALLLLVSPLYIEPIFNEYRPMDEGPLKERILSIARANGMSADDVKQVDQSKQTTRVSANVSGMLGTTRIALNDNLLKRASPDGVEAVMAHEIGHYVLNHQWKSITYFALIFGASFAAANALFLVIVRRRGAGWDVRGVDDYAGFPLLYAIITVIVFLATPLLYRITYINEYEADLFAINATQNPEAWAEVALMTAEYRKLHPPQWEESLLNHHPSPYVRIFTAMRWKAENLPAADDSELVVESR